MERTQDVNANSSPAIEVPRDAEGYAAWRQTGKLPEKSEEAATSNDDTSGAGDDASAKAAPASEAGNRTQDKSQKPRSTADTRLNEILADLRRAGLTPAELKTFKREAQAQQQTPPAADKPAQQAAPEKTDKPADAAGAKQPPKKPVETDYKTWREFEDAKDKYFEDLADYRANQALEAHRGRERQEAQRREIAEKLEEVEGRYGAGSSQTVISSAQTVFNDAKVSPAVKAIMNESPVLAEALLALGSQPQFLAQFAAEARTNPAAAIRRWVQIEHLVEAELKKAGVTPGAKRDAATGQFTGKPPAKKSTEAPPPPRESSGRAGTPPDESEAAFAANDFRRFRSSENRKELVRKKGR
jgi:hypothetical protein